MEQKILLLLQSKNEEAISLLYDKYSASIYGCILRIVHSPEIAEDILIEQKAAYLPGCIPLPETPPLMLCGAMPGKCRKKLAH